MEWTIFIFFLTLFLHIIADYLVQNDFLAKFKQKKNWEQYNASGKYTHDYIAVLACHGFSWAFITFMPIIVYYKNSICFCVIVFINTIIHCFIDDLKCNKLRINLIQDQIFHVLQILLSVIIAERIS